MQKLKGLTLESKVRNRLVNEHLSNSLKIEAPPIYSQKFASRITTGNTTDDMAKIANVDWIIEVVVERLDKKLVFEQIEKFRKPGTFIILQGFQFTL
jgi:3-hydroxyacyl-CoA dehydrogenase